MMNDIHVLVCGEAGVGKTSFLSRAMGNEFDPKYQPTLGIELYSCPFRCSTGIQQVVFYDTAGQQKFQMDKMTDGLKIDGIIDMFNGSHRGQRNGIPEQEPLWKMKFKGLPTVRVRTHDDLGVKNRKPCEYSISRFSKDQEIRGPMIGLIEWIMQENIDKKHMHSFL